MRIFLSDLYGKYFIALLIPSPLLEEIEKIKKELFNEFNLKGALRCEAHITLHRPFRWKVNREQELINDLEKFHFNSFTIQLKDFSFFEPRVIFVDVMRNESLNSLHQSLKEFAKKESKIFNEWDDMREFHPHVTIASRDLKKNKFYLSKDLFSKKEFNGTFEAQKISLMKLEKRWETIHELSCIAK